LFSGPQTSSSCCFQDLKLVAAIVSGPQGFFIEKFDSNSPDFKEKTKIPNPQIFMISSVPVGR
jgi:hypothetical protein